MELLNYASEIGKWKGLFRRAVDNSEWVVRQALLCLQSQSHRNRQAVPVFAHVLFGV